MTKLEQVARANYAEMSKPEHGFWFSGLEWEDIRGMQAAFIAGARAMVQALREPDESMTETCWEQRCHADGDGGAWIAPDDAEHNWQAMIAAVLAEAPTN